MATGNITVESWRFRNDDGSETSATWKAAKNTAATVAVPGANVKVRLRLALENLTQDVTAVYGLRVSHNGGAYADVDAASSYVRGAVSSSLTDGANTTHQMDPYAGTYIVPDIPGVVSQAAGASASVPLTVGRDGDLEWVTELQWADLANGDTLDFQPRRISGSNLAFTHYSGNIRLTVQVAGVLDLAPSVSRRTPSPTLAKHLILALMPMTVKPPTKPPKLFIVSFPRPTLTTADAFHVVMALPRKARTQPRAAGIIVSTPRSTKDSTVLTRHAVMPLPIKTVAPPPGGSIGGLRQNGLSLTRRF